jgi:hypothetical protein
VVLVRGSDPEIQLQALRTALSLSLGDRPADLLVAGDGLQALAPEPGSEAAHCLETLRRMSLAVLVDQDVARAAAHPVAEVLAHEEVVERLAGAEFIQVF